MKNLVEIAQTHDIQALPDDSLGKFTCKGIRALGIAFDYLIDRQRFTVVK